MEYTIKKTATHVEVKLTPDEVRDIYDNLPSRMDIESKFYELYKELDAAGEFND